MDFFLLENGVQQAVEGKEEAVALLGVHSGVVRGVAERMLQLVPEGRCLPAKADLRLFRGRGVE